MASTINPWHESAFLGQSEDFRLLIKRNCSISPAGLFRVFALLALATFGIGAGFAVAGAWLILPFAGLEVLALGLAFLLNGRHAGDYERIELERGRLTVEVAEGPRSARYAMDARAARVAVSREAEGYGAPRVHLRGAHGSVELGRYLDAERRVELAAELTRRLRI
ncbi:MAG TPA: DUF2244 domain-containing protein [Burkholderiales bacterium]|nr:DUF2244 domain-containing protein [Burkholderiales bacterium]